VTGDVARFYTSPQLDNVRMNSSEFFSQGTASLGYTATVPGTVRCGR